MERITLRAATAHDARFLADMLVEAKNGGSIRHRPRVSILEDPNATRYISGWMRPGDQGSVAISDESVPVGACWARVFPPHAPGAGFVAPGVPELVLGVNTQWRAQGIGRLLLRSVIQSCSVAGYQRLSLTVNRGNFAARLYVSEGFVVVENREEADTMVRRLR